MTGPLLLFVAFVLQVAALASAYVAGELLGGGVRYERASTLLGFMAFACAFAAGARW